MGLTAMGVGRLSLTLACTSIPFPLSGLPHPAVMMSSLIVCCHVSFGVYRSRKPGLFFFLFLRKQRKSSSAGEGRQKGGTWSSQEMANLGPDVIYEYMRGKKEKVF